MKLFNKYNKSKTINEQTQNGPSTLNGINIKLSEKLLSSVPYLSDKIIIKMLKDSINMTDYITLNLANYNIKSINQYKNPEKFESLLTKIRKELMFELGINSALQYESCYKGKVESVRISDFHQFRSNILKNSRPKIFLKLDTTLSDDELKSFIELSIKSKIIDAIIVGGMNVNCAQLFRKKIKLSLVEKDRDLTH